MLRLTRERILHLAQRHRLDDHAVAEIIRTGASEPELVEAVSRMTRGSEIGAERRRPITPKVARLCEILATSGDALGEPD